MRSIFEEEELNLIADRVIEKLKPLLSGMKKEDDTIFNVKGLSEYLHVTPKWIHERTHLNEIPFSKLSNKTLCFRKRDIDAWLEDRKVPVLSEHRGRLKFFK